MTLRVVDSAGNPVADAPLALAISGGAIADSSVRTDSAGKAAVHWRLGRDMGSYTLSARVTGSDDAAPVVVTAKASPGAAENLTLGASSAKGKPLAVARSVVATVTDSYGNPIRDATLRFTTKTGAVSPASVVSDANGRAKVTWTLSVKASEQLLTASVRGTELKQTLTLDSSKK